MAHARFEPCPHCQAPLSYLEGVAGSKMDPQCPRCPQGRDGDARDVPDGGPFAARVRTEDAARPISGSAAAGTWRGGSPAEAGGSYSANFTYLSAPGL